MRRRSDPRWWGLVGLGLLACWPAAARAQSPQQRAAVLLKQGQALLKKGNHSEALIVLMKAQGTFPGAENQIEIAAAYEGLDNAPEAAELYEKLLDDPNLFGKLQSRARERLDALRTRLGRVTIECRVKDAQVQVNNRDVGTTPLPASVYVEPGPVTIVVQSPARRVELTPTLSAGEHRTVKVSLRSPPPPTSTALPPPTALPAALPPPSADQNEPVKPAAPARRTEPSSTPSRGWLLGRRWTWIAAGATVVAGVIGMGLGLSASSDYQEYKDSSTPPSRYEELEQRVSDKATAANAMFVVTGALAVSTVSIYFLEGVLTRHRERASRGWSLTAGAAGRGGRLVLGTTF